MLTDRQLREMRAQQVAAMPDTCRIERWVYESDGIGGHRRQASRAVIQADVPCRFTPGELEQSLGQASRELQIEHWTVRLPYDSLVQPEDVVVWQSRDFRVMRVKVPDAYPTTTTATVVENDPHGAPRG